MNTHTWTPLQPGPYGSQFCQFVPRISGLRVLDMTVFMSKYTLIQDLTPLGHSLVPTEMCVNYSYFYYVFLLIHLTLHANYLPPKYTLINISCLSFFPVDVIKWLDRSISRERGFVLAHSSGYSLLWQGNQRGGALRWPVSHTAPTTWKQRVISHFLSLCSPGSQPTAQCHPHSGCVFPPRLSPSHEIILYKCAWRVVF